MAVRHPRGARRSSADDTDRRADSGHGPSAGPRARSDRGGARLHLGGHRRPPTGPAAQPGRRGQRHHPARRHSAVAGGGPARPRAVGGVGARGRSHRRPRPGAARDHRRLRRPRDPGRVRRRRPLGCGHLRRRQRLPVALPQRRQRRGLPARTTAARAAGAPDQPATGRRRGTGQDHRGRSGHPGAAAAAPGPFGGGGLPAESGAEVGRRDAGEVRPRLHCRQLRADGAGPPHPRPERQPVPPVLQGHRQHGLAARPPRPAAAARRVRLGRRAGQRAALRVRPAGGRRGPPRRPGRTASPQRPPRLRRGQPAHPRGP